MADNDPSSEGVSFMVCMKIRVVIICHNDRVRGL